jgi:hypothetical protein
MLEAVVQVGILQVEVTHLEEQEVEEMEHFKILQKLLLQEAQALLIQVEVEEATP